MGAFRTGADASFTVADAINPPSGSRAATPSAGGGGTGVVAAGPGGPSTAAAAPFSLPPPPEWLGVAFALPGALAAERARICSSLSSSMASPSMATRSARSAGGGAARPGVRLGTRALINLMEEKGG